ncbi:MAG TPA: aspartyl-phosphate phosphatase Spo0E family protein [Bacilli bacterium]
MRNNPVLICEIEQLKLKLERTAQKHEYNLNHPDVVAVSAMLDRLIAEHMRKKHE